MVLEVKLSGDKNMPRTKWVECDMDDFVADLKTGNEVGNSFVFMRVMAKDTGESVEECFDIKDIFSQWIDSKIKTLKQTDEQSDIGYP